MVANPGLSDLDLDSTHIEVDAVGHTPTPFWSVLCCHLGLLPGDFHRYKSLLTVLLQFVHGRLGPPRNLPVQRLSRYALVIHSYHMSKPAESSFTEYVIHIALSSSNSDRFICYSILPWNAQGAPLCHLLLLEAIHLHCAVCRRVERIIAPCNLIFTCRLIDLYYIFLIFANTAVAFPIQTLTSFSQLPLCDM